MKFCEHPVLNILIDRHSNPNVSNELEPKVLDYYNLNALQARDFFNQNNTNHKEFQKHGKVTKSAYCSLLDKVERAIINHDQPEHRNLNSNRPEMNHSTSGPFRSQMCADSGYDTQPPRSETNTLKSWSYSTELNGVEQIIDPRLALVAKSIHLSIPRNTNLKHPSNHQSTSHSDWIPYKTTSNRHIYRESNDLEPVTGNSDFEPILDSDHIRRLPKLRH